MLGFSCLPELSWRPFSWWQRTMWNVKEKIQQRRRRRKTLINDLLGGAHRRMEAEERRWNTWNHSGEMVGDVYIYIRVKSLMHAIFRSNALHPAEITCICLNALHAYHKCFWLFICSTKQIKYVLINATACLLSQITVYILYFLFM